MTEICDVSLFLGLLIASSKLARLLILNILVILNFTYTIITDLNTVYHESQNTLTYFISFSSLTSIIITVSILLLRKMSLDCNDIFLELCKKSVRMRQY